MAEEPDDFYDFTPEDYFRLMGGRIGGNSASGKLLICLDRIFVLSTN